MLPTAHWFIREVSPEALKELEENTADRGYSQVLLRLLAHRGLKTAEEVEFFLQPLLKNLTDPFLLPQMAQAVERVFQAIDAGESVSVYGDYDVDGVTSIMLLTRTLEAYGLRPHKFLPHRLEEGYGLSFAGLERCLKENSPGLLIAVDCGTTAIAQAAMLKEKGVDLVILDHHEPAQEGLPEAVAVVNPKLGDDFHYLCSAGVVFKLAHALMKQRRLDHFDLKSFLDIVAIGTVADIVPLVAENRLLVRHGLKVLNDTKHVGLLALIEVCAVQMPIEAHAVGFRIGPRINAAGRVDRADTALELMLSSDPKKSQELAQSLNEMNQIRQDMEQSMLNEAERAAESMLENTDKVGLAVGADDWHPGVVGIVASRLMKRFHRPTFVVGFNEDGLGKGSGRSIGGISLVQAINECRDLLINGGGHEMAAGISLRKENFPAFQERFAEAVSRQVTDASILQPRLYGDVEIRLPELTLEFIQRYELLQPFGNSNEPPLFFCLGVEPAVRPDGQEELALLKGRHLRLMLYQDGVERKAMWFNAVADGQKLVLPRPPWDIAFHPGRNSFQGKDSVQLTINAIRSSGPVSRVVMAPKSPVLTVAEL